MSIKGIALRRDNPKRPDRHQWLIVNGLRVGQWSDGFDPCCLASTLELQGYLEMISQKVVGSVVERYRIEQVQDEILIEEADPVCTACGDTHLMTITTPSGDTREVMCTRCPRPCSDCSTGPGYGPYCRETPCDCGCHEG